MKKIFTILSVATIILAAGCTKDLSHQETQTPYRTVKFNCNAGTKVSLDTDSKQISWHWTEYLSVYSFTADASDPATGKKFTATDSSSEFSGEIIKDAAKVYAVYPFYGAGYDGGKETVSAATETPLMCTPDGEITTTLGQTQYLVKDNISSCSNLAACIADIDEEGNLTGTLKNVCAYLKFTLANASTLPIRQILVESVNDAKLSGLATISFDSEGTPVVTGLESTYVVGMADNNASAFEDGTYYMTFFPADLSSGLHVTLSGTDGNIYEFTTQGFNAKRNQVYNLGTVDAGRTATPGVTTVLLNAGTTTMPQSVPSAYTTFTDGGYEFGCYNVAKKYGGIYFNNTSSAKAFIESPAIEGKVLRKINVTYMSGTDKAYKTTMRVNNATGTTSAGTTKYTGNYQANETKIANYKTLRFLLSDNSKAYFFHQFVLGTIGDREGGSLTSGITLSEGTKYQLAGVSSQNQYCLVRFIEFVYSDSE